MKNIVRTFVIALTLTGAAASARTSQVVQNPAQLAIPGSTSSLMPVPMCPPNDPNACGMGR